VKKSAIFLILFIMPWLLQAQQVMTPELLWSLGRVSALGQSPDGNTVLYRVAKTDLKTEGSNLTYYLVDVNTRKIQPTTAFEGKNFIQWDANGLYATEAQVLKISRDMGATWTTLTAQLEDAENIRISPDGEWLLFSKSIPFFSVMGKDSYPQATNSTAQIYTDLNYRHWDTWNDGKVSHLFLANLKNATTPVKDLLQDEPYECPQKPFGGAEDFIFSPDSKTVVYVSKKKTGKEYAQSTNTDIYAYDIATGKTTNWSSGMMGYDMAPAFNNDGKKIAWLSMKQDGYEADKNDIVVMDVTTGTKTNLTSGWDETVDGGFIWNNTGDKIYFNASIKGTRQLFSVNTSGNAASVQQISSGDFDITGILGQSGQNLTVSRTDINHATELFTVNTGDGTMQPLTHTNDMVYKGIGLSKTTLRMVTTTDGKQMGVWVIYPPDFNPNKKYPTLLYCQGGPQSALTQFYSVRWNFQLMAANGYIVVAPNRRGMPGWGVQWNADISKDWGGQPMQDYLSAIDALAKEPYVDKDRLGCVGASYGGYSVYMLAGIHQNRFKTFIAHDGLFDMKSWYGTTEELWFANWDLGGNYWQKPQPTAYEKFNPSNFVDQWTAPILIIQGGIDFRVPIEQGLEAFQAAQLRNIKSKLLYFPNENHWVLHAHNGLVWQHEFFKWLKETL